MKFNKKMHYVAEYYIAGSYASFRMTKFFHDEKTWTM